MSIYYTTRTWLMAPLKQPQKKWKKRTKGKEKEKLPLGTGFQPLENKQSSRPSKADRVIARCSGWQQLGDSARERKGDWEGCGASGEEQSTAGCAVCHCGGEVNRRSDDARRQGLRKKGGQIDVQSAERREREDRTGILKFYFLYWAYDVNLLGLVILYDVIKIWAKEFYIYWWNF